MHFFFLVQWCPSCFTHLGGRWPELLAGSSWHINVQSPLQFVCSCSRHEIHWVPVVRHPEYRSPVVMVGTVLWLSSDASASASLSVSFSEYPSLKSSQILSCGPALSKHRIRPQPGWTERPRPATDQGICLKGIAHKLNLKVFSCDKVWHLHPGWKHTWVLLRTESTFWRSGGRISFP